MPEEVALEGGSRESTINACAPMPQCLLFSAKGTQDLSRGDLRKDFKGTSLVVQWLRLCAANAGYPGLIPGQGTRSHITQLKDSAGYHESATK